MLVLEHLVFVRPAATSSVKHSDFWPEDSLYVMHHVVVGRIKVALFLEEGNCSEKNGTD